MNFRELCEAMGFLAGSSLIVGLVFTIIKENNHEAQFQIGNTQLITSHSQLVSPQRPEEIFTYGETEYFSVITGDFFESKCLKTQPDNIKNHLGVIIKLTSNNKFGRIYTLSNITNSKYQLIKLLPATHISQIKCQDFTYDQKSQELIYNKKPLRLLLNMSYKSNYENIQQSLNTNR